jgi:hypothetical protein
VKRKKRGESLRKFFTKVHEKRVIKDDNVRLTSGNIQKRCSGIYGRNKIEGKSNLYRSKKG